ncbi:hypothetical protein QJS66_23715 (plasmid) [Kocuria rhizophila]|nr:hypothetical protein QJS66_23715 [Kocuria rhizophila]
MTAKTQAAKKQPTKKQQEHKAAAIAKRKEVSGEGCGRGRGRIKNDRTPPAGSPRSRPVCPPTARVGR